MVAYHMSNFYLQKTDRPVDEVSAEEIESLG